LFQVASQFNLLEMTGPSVTPEDGVTIYQHDRTQGPACAIAAGAATIYRNYFAKVGGAEGQTKDRQLDGLADLGVSLSAALGHPVEALWEMRNGYALCSRAGLDEIAKHIRAARPDQIDLLRGKLRIGLHHNVEVTDCAGAHPLPLVSQAFCSALPVAYSRVAAAHWKEFASLVIEAAYEATMWAAVSNAERGISNVVLLTSLSPSFNSFWQTTSRRTFSGACSELGCPRWPAPAAAVAWRRHGEMVQRPRTLRSPARSAKKVFRLFLQYGSKYG
jgi:hypothetical protein